MKLWQQISLICSLLIVLVVVSCSAVQLRLTREKILSITHEQAAEKQHSLAVSFREMADYYTADSDSQAVKRSLVKYCFRQFADSSAVLVIDGETFYSALSIDPQKLVRLENLAGQQQFSVLLDGRSLIVTVSRLYLMAFPQVDCFVYVVEDISPVYAELEKLIYQFALIGGLCAAAGILLITILVRRSMGPLATLQQAASHIAEGDYARRVEIESNDEVGALAHSFDKMAGAVQRHVEELRETNRRQKLFIGAVSHEFKTPLTGIILSADSLQNTYMDEDEQAAALSRIETQARWLERLVQKMLRLLTLEREIKPGAVDAAALLERVRESTEASLQKQGISLETDCRMQSLTGDADLLQSALVNLVDNAARASQPGQSVRLSAFDNILEVSDAGRGIAPEALAHVTEPFYMEDKARSKKQGGVGLGLALVKETAQAHGAELEIVSEPGTGTRIRIIFSK